MPLRQAIFIILAVAAFLLTLLAFDSVTSMVPGWHTTIYVGPSWNHWLFSVLLLVISFLYRRTVRKAIFISRAFFIWHVLFTVVVYVVANYGTAAAYLFLNNQNVMWMVDLVIAAWWAQWILLAGQVIFGALLWSKLTYRPQLPESGI